MTNIFQTLFFIVLQFQTAQAGTSLIASKSCVKAKSAVEKRFATLFSDYQKISTETILDENRPTWTWGTNNEAIYLSHGFIGTPEEMSAVAKVLSKNGFTVLNDIIPGHGASGFIANAYDEVSWQKHVEANINSLNECFKKIHFVGFSTGALLIHDYLLRHPQFNSAASVTFYSPFYIPNYQYVGFLNFLARFFTPVVPTSYIYSVSHFPDLKVAVLKPSNYLQLLPLDSAASVARLGKSVSKLPDKSFNVPTLAFVSDTDNINNTSETIKNVASDFKNLTLVHYKDDYVPHHLMVAAVSSKAKEVIEQTLKFIKQH